MNLTKDDIITYWDIQNATLQLNHYKTKEYESIVYQNQILTKVFDIDSPLEKLDMIHKHELSKSYVYMLQYIQDHRVDSIRNIDLPEPIDNKTNLSLTSSSVRQLNVINNYSYYKGKHESLFSICNQCGYIGGRRLLRLRLLYPSTNIQAIKFTLFKSGSISSK